MDLAGRDFWEGFWHRQDGRLFTGLSHFHRQLSALLRNYASEGRSVCEIGCGASAWMPVLAAGGADVWGIDYSATGITLARQNLERAGVTARLIEGDVRDPEALPRDRFDAVFSMGFIEHFDDAANVLKGIARSLKPGGAMITLVPNFAGPWGQIQKRVDPELFDVHTVYTPETLDALHRDAGLGVREPARYFGGFGPLVVNYTRPLGRVPPRARALFTGAMWAAQQSVGWSLDVLGARDRPSYSAQIAGVYERL